MIRVLDGYLMGRHALRGGEATNLLILQELEHPSVVDGYLIGRRVAA